MLAFGTSKTREPDAAGRELRRLVGEMLRKDKEDRPTAAQVTGLLSTIRGRVFKNERLLFNSKRSTVADMSRPRVAETEQSILEGALVAFAENGYAGTSLRDLMAAAGLSTTAFYARFASKEAVLDALIARLTERLLERARTAMNQAESVEAGFETGARVLAEIVLPERAVLRLALGEGMASEGARDTLRTVYATLSGLLTTRLERLMAKGAISAVDAPALGDALTGAMQLHLVRWAVLDATSDEELPGALVRTARALLPTVRRAPLAAPADPSHS